MQQQQWQNRIPIIVIVIVDNCCCWLEYAIHIRHTLTVYSTRRYPLLVIYRNIIFNLIEYSFIRCHKIYYLSSVVVCRWTYKRYFFAIFLLRKALNSVAKASYIRNSEWKKKNEAEKYLTTEYIQKKSAKGDNFRLNFYDEAIDGGDAVQK